MAKLQEIHSSWKKLILNGDVKIALQQFESEVLSDKWTIEEQNSMANYCLIITNMRAYELVKSKDEDPFTPQNIFLMTNFCCCIIKQTWKCKAAEFLGSVHVICHYLLASDNIKEALIIGQYCMEFVDRNVNNLCKDEKTTVENMILLYLDHLNKMPVDNLKTMLDIWEFILSSQGVHAKKSHVALIFKCFLSFCYKINSKGHLQSSLLIMPGLSKMPFINFTDMDIDKFMNICELVIRNLKTDQLKNNILIIVDCIEKMNSSFSTDQHLVLQFCSDVLRFSICSQESESSIFVDKCLRGLNCISSVIPMLRDRAVNFARVVLIQTQNSWISVKKFYYRDCLPNFFAFFTKLSETAKSIETDKNDDIKEHRYFNASSLSLLIITRVQDWSSEELIGIYSCVKKCLSISLDVYNDDCKINNSQKSQLYNNIGAHCFNVCWFYMKAKLYNECEELSLMSIQKITAVSNDLIQNSSLQSYIEKLASCLHQSNKYEAALKTTCIWAAKLPDSRNAFMIRYISFKSKIFYENQDNNMELVNKTCWDLIKDHQQENHRVWEKIKFTLLKLELKQLFIHQIWCVDLVEKIISQSKKGDNSTKIEVYILAGLIFTQSSKLTNNAMNLLPMVDKCIEELDRKLVKKITKEEVIKYINFLGCLHYVKFRIQLLNARCKNEEEIMITSSIKSVPSEPGMEQEIRDDSDVIHKYLIYKSQLEFISYLDSAIDCWSRALTEATEIEDPEQLKNCLKIYEEMDIQTLIQETALMFRLYCAECNEIRAWKLLHKLASFREDDEKIVYAYSNLVSLNVQIDPESETKVQEKLPSVEKTTQIRYRLEIIHKLFINGRGIEGITMLSQISEDDVKSSDILAAKYNFIMSQYTLANFYKPSDYPLKTAFRAFHLLLNSLKTYSWRYFWEGCEIQSLFLDVGLFIIQFHLDTYQTTLIQTFADKVIYLIKKLGLPLRICRILTALCTVGVITCKCENVYVKLDVLKSILTFNDSTQEKVYDEKPPMKTPATLSSADFHSNTDVRFVSNFDDNYTSPILESGLKYDMPEFVYHKSHCECVICNDMHYQQISCEVMSLFGSYFWLQKSNHHGQALRHFEDALEMSSKLCNRWKDIDRSKIDGFLKTRIVTKIRLGDFWASTDKFENAEKLNKEASNDYENLTVQSGALRAQLTDQYFSLEYIKFNASIKQDLPKKRAVRQKLQLGSTAKPSACKPTIKIFEDDELKSRISELMNSMAITPIPRHSRRLLFKDDDEFCKPTASSRVTRIKNKKEGTPPDIVMQTPSSLRFNPTKQPENKITSTRRLLNDDDLFSIPAKLTSSSRVKKSSKTEDSTDADIVVHIPSSRTRLKTILQSKIPSAVVKIDEDLLAASAKPSSSIRNTRKKTTKGNHVPLDIIKTAPDDSNRTRPKKIAEKTDSSSVSSSSNSRLKIRKN